MADHAWEMQRVSRMVRKVHNSCELMRNSSIWGTDHIYNLTLKVYVAENGMQDQDGLLCILYLTRATLISDRSSGRCCSFLSKGFSSLLLVAALNLSTQCKLHVHFRPVYSNILKAKKEHFTVAMHKCSNFQYCSQHPPPNAHSTTVLNLKTTETRQQRNMPSQNCYKNKNKSFRFCCWNL